MSESIQDRLLDLIAEYKEISRDEIEITRPFSEMGLDSLDTAEMIMEIEQEFGVTIDLSADLNTVEKLILYIESQQ